MDPLANLTTEQRNPRSLGIDTRSTSEILRTINREDRRVPRAVSRALPEITRLVDRVVVSFRDGGRLLYVGAGTSGRLGVLDASECPPTFGVSREMVQGIIAGGPEALVRSIEFAEDSEETGALAADQHNVSAQDTLIGITASGQAPFVIGAMKRARQIGAAVGALSCNRNSGTFAHADYPIYVHVGPEIITGSTRMKAGTAQKLVLNMITTTAMIRIGKVYNNLMVDLNPVNAKLIHRSRRIIRAATGCSVDEAEQAFENSGRKPKVAIVMILLDVEAGQALRLLAENDGRIGDTVRAAKTGQ